MMTLIDEITAKIALVAIFALVVAWFCGVFCLLGDIAAAAKMIATMLGETAKKQKEEDK